MIVKIAELKRYAAKGSGPEVLQEAKLLAGRGIEGDRHKNPNRQVSILTKQARLWMNQQKEKGLCFERVKENILLNGLCPSGSRLSFGDAILQLRPERKHCLPACIHREKAALCPLMEGMFFADVLEGGAVSVGESGTVEARFP